MLGCGVRPPAEVRRPLLFHASPDRARLNAPQGGTPRSWIWRELDENPLHWLRPGRHPGWLWPVAVLLGFPIGGLIADLVVDGVDSVGAALAAGLIAGAIIGAAEWFALRQWVSWLWIPATTAGMAVGLAAGAALVDYGSIEETLSSWVP